VLASAYSSSAHLSNLSTHPRHVTDAFKHHGPNIC
jgi:hypothetical protein